MQILVELVVRSSELNNYSVKGIQCCLNCSALSHIELSWCRIIIASTLCISLFQE